MPGFFGLRHKWTFIQCTMSTADDHMQPLRDTIYNKLIPTLIKHKLNYLERELVMLPAQFGGTCMSFDDPVVDSRCKYVGSIKCTANLTQQIWKVERI